MFNQSRSAKAHQNQLLLSLAIYKRKVQDTEQVKETVRKEVADIDEDVEDKDRNRF
jgi:stress response protein YsnF